MFLTLTVTHTPGGDVADAARRLSKAWRLLRLRIMRGKPEKDRLEAAKNAARASAEPAPATPNSWPFRKTDKLKPLPFILVVERDASGWPHLHILLRCRFIKQEWLSCEMQALLQSPITDVRRIKKHQLIAGYIAKYCGKDPHMFKGCKRYWQSQDYDLRPEPDKPARPWVVSTEILSFTTLATWIDRELCCGRSIEHVSFKSARSRPRYAADPPRPPGGLSLNASFFGGLR